MLWPRCCDLGTAVDAGRLLVPTRHNTSNNLISESLHPPFKQFGHGPAIWVHRDGMGRENVGEIARLKMNGA
jgi:hypothetical protein